MAAEEAWTCPVCGDARQDTACVIPCNHTFCLGCIQRWARLRDSCPLCRTAMETIRVSVRGDNQYVECIVSPPALPVPVGFGSTITAAGPESEEDLLPPLSPELSAVEPERVGGLLLQEWAALFRARRDILDPVLPWLEQELRRNGEERWWKIDWLRSMILAFLCQVGPDRDVLVECSEHALGPASAPLIDALIATIESRCGPAARRLQGIEEPGAAQEHDDGLAAPPGPGAAPQGIAAPSAAPSGGSAGPDAEELPGASNGAPSEDAGELPAAPSLREREQPSEEPGPSQQRRSRGPSAPGRGRKRSAGSPRRPTKRRAGSAQRAPPPRKRRRPRRL